MPKMVEHSGKLWENRRRKTMQFLNFHDMGLATLKIKKMGSWHLKNKLKTTYRQGRNIQKRKNIMQFII